MDGKAIKKSSRLVISAVDEEYLDEPGEVGFYRLSATLARSRSTPDLMIGKIMSYHTIIVVISEHTASTVAAHYAMALAVSCR